MDLLFARVPSSSDARSSRRLDLRVLTNDLIYQGGKRVRPVLYAPCVFHESTMQRFRHATGVSEDCRFNRMPITLYALRIHASNRIDKV